MNENDLSCLSNTTILEELKNRGIIDSSSDYYNDNEMIDYILNDLFKQRKNFDNFFDELFWQMNDEQKYIIVEILKKRNIVK